MDRVLCLSRIGKKKFFDAPSQARIEFHPKAEIMLIGLQFQVLALRYSQKWGDREKDVLKRDSRYRRIRLCTVIRSTGGKDLPRPTIPPDEIYDLRGLILMDLQLVRTHFEKHFPLADQPL
jgi:hypothetical protein